MDLSIPNDVAQSTQAKLSQLIEDFTEGYLTEKGYIMKRKHLLSIGQAPMKPIDQGAQKREEDDGQPSLSATQSIQTQLVSSGLSDTTSTKFSIAITDDFHKPNVDDATTHPSTNDGFQLHENEFFNAEIETEIKRSLQKPLDPRNIMVNTVDNSLDSLAMILRKRATMYEKQPAVLVLDDKGRETKPLTWEKLYFKAEKVAKQIKSKAALYPGDRVCLIYQKVEVSDFMVALFGCFLSGTVAIPLNSSTPVRELVVIMKETQTHLCLMSDSVFKHFDKLQKTTKQTFWPKGMNVWKTTDMGSYRPSKKEGNPPLKISDLAYIDYTKSASGEWKGVVISHNTILNQMKMLSTIFATSPVISTPVVRPTNKQSRARNTIMATLDVRSTVGIITSVLFSIYSGNLIIWIHPKTAEIPGLYANMISTYRSSILLSDYDTLKTIVYNYQSFPQRTQTFSKKRVDLSSVSWCLIDTPIVDCEFNEVLCDRWFKPLGHQNPRQIISPILSLNEQGGAIISMRDWYGHEDRLGCTFQEKKLSQGYGEDDDEYEEDEFEDQKNSDKLSEVYIDKFSLTTNSVVVVNDSGIKSSSLDSAIHSKLVRVGSFGYPLPDATLALVNPETKVLSGVMEVGEIWVDSHCISGGFWGLPDQTQEIFQAECEDYQGVLSLKFVRTGLLGFTYNGKVYVLGLCEDRINQRLTWLDQSYQIDKKESDEFQNEAEETHVSVNLTQVLTNKFIYRYHFSTHLSKTLQKYLPDVKACAFFNLIANNEYLIFAVVEIQLSDRTESSSVQSSLQNNLKFHSLCEQVFKILEENHKVRPFNILITTKGSISRSLSSGRFEVANSLTKKKFLEGRLSAIYSAFNPYFGTGTLYHNEDFVGGIWSPYSSSIRQELLSYANLQTSGLDWREACMDDRSNIDLNLFKTPYDLLKFRSDKQSDELAFAQLEGPIIKEHKQLTTWKKFESNVFSICAYILEKKSLKSGSHVILLYSLGEDLLAAIFACWLAGLIPIVLPTFSKESRYQDEDVEEYVTTIKKFKIQAIFVNNESEQSVKTKPISSKLKLVAAAKGVLFPKTRNTAKHGKTASAGKRTYKIMEKYRQGIGKRPNYDLIWRSWDADYSASNIYLTFNELMKMCFCLKETCQMKSSSPLIASGKYTSGFGFMQAVLLGAYIGTTTYFMTPMDFGANPQTFFQALSRYKIQNIQITGKMLKYSMKKNAADKIDLSNIKNLMINWEGNRPDGKAIEVFLERFANCNIAFGVINNIYEDIRNPLLSTRSYLNFEPVKLWLDPYGLARGYISLINGNDSSNAIAVVDSGVVSVNTEVIIVNPETGVQCRMGEFGEIWVSSASTVSSKNMGTIKGAEYYRTGELGFLHPVKKQQAQKKIIEVELLYTLGPIAETFEVAGLQFFIQDIEQCVKDFIGVDNAIIFKINDVVVLIVATDTKRSLSNVSSLIAIKVLNKFKLILDVISFVSPKEFLLSRIGLPQRLKMFKKWMGGKLNLIESFGVGSGEKALCTNIQKMVAVNENINDKKS